MQNCPSWFNEYRYVDNFLLIYVHLLQGSKLLHLQVFLYTKGWIIFWKFYI